MHSAIPKYCSAECRSGPAGWFKAAHASRTNCAACACFGIGLGLGLGFGFGFWLARRTAARPGAALIAGAAGKAQRCAEAAMEATAPRASCAASRACWGH